LNTDIKNVIEAVGEESQYDEKAKKILGNKHILAYILCRTVEEFKGVSPKEVFSLIEGEPLINKVPVEPGMTNSKMGSNKMAGERKMMRNTAFIAYWGRCFRISFQQRKRLM
jgi:hypothetical protein